MTLGERIKTLRQKAGLTQEELANEIGYATKTSISKIENDVLDINQSTIVALARALKTTPSVIMGWVEPDVNSANLTNREEKNIHQREYSAREDKLILNYRLLNATGQAKVDEYISDLVDSGKYAETNTTSKSHLLLVGKGGSADVEIKDPKGLDEEVEKLKKKHGLK